MGESVKNNLSVDVGVWKSLNKLGSRPFTYERGNCVGKVSSANVLITSRQRHILTEVIPLLSPKGVPSLDVAWCSTGLQLSNCAAVPTQELYPSWYSRPVRGPALFTH